MHNYHSLRKAQRWLERFLKSIIALFKALISEQRGQPCTKVNNRQGSPSHKRHLSSLINQSSHGNDVTPKTDHTVQHITGTKSTSMGTYVHMTIDHCHRLSSTHSIHSIQTPHSTATKSPIGPYLADSKLRLVKKQPRSLKSRNQQRTRETSRRQRRGGTWRSTLNWLARRHLQHLLQYSLNIIL